MRTVFFELTNGFNWGKFMVAQFDGDELAYESALDATMGVRSRLIRARGWGPDHYLVLDLQTGEAAMFRHGGHASADLDKRRIWTCPMFEPFLKWLFVQDLHRLDELPPLVELTEAEAPSAMQGYRRSGTCEALVEFS